MSKSKPRTRNRSLRSESSDRSAAVPSLEAPATAELAPVPGIAPPPRKLYKIGEVMRYTGLSRQTIHNYTMLGLITEDERTPSGHRLYGESVFYRLEKIQELKRTKSLKEVRQVLEEGEG